MTAPEVPSQCVVCASDRLAPDLRRDGFEYFRCSTCGDAFLSDNHDVDDLEAFYAEDYFRDGRKGGYRDYLADEPLHRRNARARLALVEHAHGREPGSLLEIGSATGFLVDEARALGWDVAGVEISPWARAVAQERTGVRLVASLQDAPAGPFDVIVLFQVLAHLPDPRATLAALAERMSPDGCIVAETWDRGSMIARLSGAYWQQVTPPSVRHLYDRAALRRMFALAGLDVVSVRSTAKRISVGAGLQLVGEKLPAPLGAPLLRLARTRLGTIGVPYRLGDLITVVARRRGARGSNRGLDGEIG